MNPSPHDAPSGICDQGSFSDVERVRRPDGDPDQRQSCDACREIILHHPLTSSFLFLMQFRLRTLAHLARISLS